MRRIRRLHLRNFRNHAAFDLEVTSPVVAIHGANGAGKTNILEALSLMGGGRGLRRAAAPDLSRQGGVGDWGIGLEIEGADDLPLRLALQAEPQGGSVRKTARVDSAPVRSPTAFLDYLHFQWLTPAQDSLFTGSPGDRRRFVDRMVLGTRRQHADDVTRYETAMRQRQAALQDGADPVVLSSLEQQMARRGMDIVIARARTIGAIAEGHAALVTGAFPKARLQMEGALEMRHRDGAPPEELAAELTEALRRGRGRDREAGRALSGPHRADLSVVHASKDQPARLCSTGEQKALLIGLTLAHASAMAARHETPCVLLLDEVAAHLDPARRAALAKITLGLGLQTFMTGTDPELFAAWGEGAQSVPL